MKTADQVKPNYGPTYAAAMYPELARIFVDRGYALAVHGSLARDLDLIAVPWVENPKSIDEVLKAVTTHFAVRLIGEPELRPHGRLVYSLCVAWGDCGFDISFIPTSPPRSPASPAGYEPSTGSTAR